MVLEFHEILLGNLKQSVLFVSNFNVLDILSLWKLFHMNILLYTSTENVKSGGYHKEKKIKFEPLVQMFNIFDEILWIHKL